VTWQVTGSTAGSTIVPLASYADPNWYYHYNAAELRVADGETAASLTVTVTSAQNPSLSVSETVTIEDGKIHGTNYTYSNWTAKTPPGFNNAKDIAFGDNTLVAINAARYVSRSTDYGVTWNSQEILAKWVDDTMGGGWYTYTNLNGVAYGNYNSSTPTFVIVGNSLSFAYSTDNGATWNNGAYTGSLTTHAVAKVAFGNNTFVAVTSSGCNVCYSTDGGANWLSVDVNSCFGSTSALRDIVYDGSHFVIVNQQGKLAYSSDGINWTAGETISSIIALGQYTGGIFLLGNGEAFYSTDHGATYTQFTGLPPEGGTMRQLYAGAYGDGVYFFTQLSNSSMGQRYLYSSDGANWKYVSDPAINLMTYNRFIYAHGNFYGVSDTGKVVFSAAAPN
jgi:hypothetical protein